MNARHLLLTFLPGNREHCAFGATAEHSRASEPRRQEKWYTCSWHANVYLQCATCLLLARCSCESVIRAASQTATQPTVQKQKTIRTNPNLMWSYAREELVKLRIPATMKGMKAVRPASLSCAIFSDTETGFATVAHILTALLGVLTCALRPLEAHRVLDGWHKRPILGLYKALCTKAVHKASIQHSTSVLASRCYRCIAFTQHARPPRSLTCSKHSQATA